MKNRTDGKIAKGTGFILSEFRLPSEPGCYLFKDNRNHVLYIGKAKNLKKRVTTYFGAREQDPKTARLVTLIKSIDFIVTGNEKEALVLENNLIKKYQPKYNIDLKDSKQYSYIIITREQFPRLMATRNRGEQGEYFGPFTSAAARANILAVLNSNFKLRICRRMGKKACLRKHLNLCDAPCIGSVSKGEYNQRIQKCRMVLKGKTREILVMLNQDMQKAAAGLKFEKAIEFRNQINAVNRLAEEQVVEQHKKGDADIINYLLKEDRVYLMMFYVYKGILLGKQVFEFDFIENFLEEFLVQYYSDNSVPKEIILPVSADDAITEFLTFKRGSNVKITVPLQGAKFKLLKLVKKNIEISFFSSQEKMASLKQQLRLPIFPRTIECFDISHYSGTSMTASMVFFQDGLPDKNNYRRFKIKSFTGIDDYAALQEVVQRRYTRLLKEKQKMPNLIVIDGGRGQLNAAAEILAKLKLKIPMIAIAKRMEEIFTTEQQAPVILKPKSPGLNLVTGIRDEAHRFAIKYSRWLHKKNSLK